MAEIFVFVGTYTEDIEFGTEEILRGEGEGIYILALDSTTGRLRHCRTAEGIVNPSYLCMEPRYRFLYAVNELKIYEGKASGAVSAFSLDPDTKDLQLLNKQPTQGTDPCHVCLNAAGTHAFVSNFMSGSVCVFPVLNDGSLGEASQFIQHSGNSHDPRRQAGPHAHSLTFDPENRFAFVPDLGMDKLMVYAHNPAAGYLTPPAVAYYPLPPGSGPRHFEFHPNGNLAYLINELSSGIVAFRYDRKTGYLWELQTVSTLPEGFNGDNTCADIHIPAFGRFVYGSNRGHDSIVIYKIDEESGLLSYIGHRKTGGKTPRNFAVDPAGKFLLAANQDSNTIVTFRINAETGALTQICSFDIPTPVCVKCAIF
ncbi:MAG: lactonase family protein [Spirochaetales bacterium]|jgi:6-phosphogluconolactonase|nr:lactonase family protein [Spirochaetales bacterium]